jgi:hypothetical protein
MVLATDDHKLLYLCDRDHLDAVTIVHTVRTLPMTTSHVETRAAPIKSFHVRLPVVVALDSLVADGFHSLSYREPCVLRPVMIRHADDGATQALRAAAETVPFRWGGDLLPYVPEPSRAGVIRYVPP